MPIGVANLVEHLKNVDELSDEEISQICKVFNVTFSEAGLGFALYRDIKEWKERYLEIKMKGEADDVLVSFIKESGEIIATTIVTIKKAYVQGELLKFAFIDDVAVLPKHQGKGFGKRVFLKAQKYVDESDVSASVLYTEYKGKAWHIYRKNGYFDGFFYAVAFKILNKRAFKKALKSSLFKFILNFIPKKAVPEEEEVEVLSLEDYERFNEFGRGMNLYTPITKYRLERTSFIFGCNGFLASASIRDFGTAYGYRFKVGIISNIVYENSSCAEKVIKTLTKKLADSGVVFIISFAMENSIKHVFKDAGYYVHGRVEGPSRFVTSVGMIKPITEDISIIERIKFGKIYAPTEHMIGDW